MFERLDLRRVLLFDLFHRRRARHVVHHARARQKRTREARHLAQPPLEALGGSGGGLFPGIMPPFSHPMVRGFKVFNSRNEGFQNEGDPR